jgi:cobalamin biosynthesis protein CobT
MRTEEFQHELTSTSALFGRKSKVRVTFSGQRACTDGEMVNLPQMRAGKKLGVEEQQVMRGYVDHESGHLRHSDMPLLMEKYAQYAAEGRTLAKTLHNALEDVWLERRVMREYPGAKVNLKATTRAVNERGYETLTHPDEAWKVVDPCYITPFALTWEGRLPYDEPSNEKLLDLLPDEVRAPLAGWIERVLECKNSAEVFELSEEIEELLKRERREKREEEDEDDAEDSEESEEKDDDGTDDDDAGDGGGEPDDGDDADDPAEPDPATGEGEAGDEPDSSEGEAEGRAARADGEGEEDGGLEPEPEPEVFEDFDLGDVIEEVMAETGLTGGADGHYYQAWSTKDDRFIVANPTGDEYERRLAGGSRAAYDTRLANMTGEVNTLRRMLERSLLTQQMRDWDFGQESGRLDSRRFPAALSGKTNVFKRRMDRPEVDTAVTFLVDLSGSMRGAKRFLAMDCAIAMAEAIERTDVAYEVLGFSQPVFDAVPPTRELKLSRWEWIGMHVFKPFEQRLAAAKPTMSQIAASAEGNNCDGESLMMAWSRLKQRREKRKVMFVMSDGFPQCYTHMSEAHLGRHLRGVVQYLEEQQCQCVGVGIMSDSVKHFYRDHVVVNELGDLSAESLSLLGKVLLGDRRGLDTSELVEGMRV